VTCSIWHALKCVRIKTWAALEREFAHFDGGGMSTCDGVITGLASLKGEGRISLQFTARSPWIMLTISAGFHLKRPTFFLTGPARMKNPGVASSLEVSDEELGQ
jgi:hypothetical protein